MNLISIEKVSRSFGDKVILKEASFGIDEGDKVGVIGINGTGKTTLLRMIAGIEEPDEGKIITRNGLRVAYLEQSPVFDEDKTILECVVEGIKGLSEDEILSRTYEAESILNELGILDHMVKTAHLSGGQKKRVALAACLVSPADLIILDEPTNHIDAHMARWLEDYLKRFKGAILLVTHDRYFLDRVCNRIMEMSHAKLYSYECAYEKYLQMKAEREEMELVSEKKRQDLIRQETKWALRGARARTTKQKFRLQRLEQLKEGTGPETDGNVKMSAVTTRIGRKTIELKGVSKGFGGHTLISDFEYIVLRGQHLGIIGPNGCGKTTLMKLLSGLARPDAGTIEWGETIHVGYFAQEDEEMDGEMRVIDAVKEVAEYITTADGKISASKLLEEFLFDPSMQYTPIKKLSGGEKRRLQLLRVLAEGANVLLLDEPTNDLDIPTLTILEDFLNQYDGIVIAVSHDRYFLDSICDRIFAFENENGRPVMRQYEGGYREYEEKKKTMGWGDDPSMVTLGKKAEQSKAEKPRSSERSPHSSSQKLKFTFKEQREYETIDEDIARLEEAVAQLEDEMSKNASNYVKLSELTEEKEKKEQELEEKMDRWVYLNDLAEKIAAQ